MSKGTWFRNLFTYHTSLDPQGEYKKEIAAKNEAADVAAAEKQAEAQAKAVSEQITQRQKAKQIAAINTISRGFGSNESQNLSRSFLLRL